VLGWAQMLPLVIFALATAGLGLWELVTGRPLFGAARWPLNPRATRWGGAYTFAGSFVVVVLAVTYSSGIAFMTYAIVALAFAGTVEVSRRRRARI
jgi:hypothetical protein